MTNKYLILLWLLLCTLLPCTAQTVTNVRFEQVNDKVKITYSLDKIADISVCVSTDGGKSWSKSLDKVKGDVGNAVSLGNNTIWWTPLEEMDSIKGGDICFKVTPSGGSLTFDVNGVSFTMVFVNADNLNGSSDYYIGQTEVTQGLWDAVMGTSVKNERDVTQKISRQEAEETFLKDNKDIISKLENNTKISRQEINQLTSSANEFRIKTKGRQLYGVGANYPMYYVNWFDAIEFCQRLSEIIGKTFNLPTDEQWGFAASGAKKLIQARKRIYETDYRMTTPVKNSVSNGIGMYGMSGNVWEWCSHDESYISRGGSSYSMSQSSRLLSYKIHAPNTRDGNLGFRIVMIP